jgi:hypothetical protein
MQKEKLMKKFTNELQAIIDQAITEKTFSLEVIDRIKEMKDSISALESNLEVAQETIKARDARITELNNSLFEANGRLLATEELLDGWKKREADVVKREIDQRLVDNERMFQTRRGDEMKEIVMAMCKNPTFVQTKSVQKQQVMPPNNNGLYPSTYTLNDSETIEETVK